MISSFYQRYSLWIIGAFLCSLAVIHPLAESIPPNNNTETWLADGNQAQSLYEDFRYHFGGEELILLTLNRQEHAPAFIEVLCRRLEGLDEIRAVWSPARFEGLMTEFGVDEEQIPVRLNQVAISKDGQLAGLAAMLTPAGLKDRAATMTRVTEVLEYCNLAPGDVHITGAPAIIAELDRLGGKQANQTYFGITILICLSVLWMTLRQLVPSVLILASTIWAFQLTLSIVYLWGGEMNFILDSLPVMIMVFTMAIAIHYLYHHAGHLDSPNPVGSALRSVSWPCFLAMLTTGIGLASLGTSSIPPVRQFGIATAGGTIAALVAGLGITPAILTRYPPVKYQQKCWARWFEILSDWLQPRSKPIAVFVSVGVLGCACGLWWLEAEFQPLNFFPESSKVLQDTKILREQMANTDSVEVVIDFGNRGLTDTQRVDIVRNVEQSLCSLDRVPIVLSATTWLPDPMPQGLTPELAAIRRHSEENDFIADGGHIWRLSARINPSETVTQQDIFEDVETQAAKSAEEHGVSIYCTGIAPLVELAQQNIFWGFWQSVLMACGLITVIMMGCLRSFWAGLIAMFPNVTPILIVFGLLGWFGVATDIGTMMTGSIALGIAVDGTFHFLTRYRELYSSSNDTRMATRVALVETGPPIVQATLVTGFGMLALSISNFVPTSRFGLLMAASLGVALIGDLILLPCLLFLRPAKKNAESDEKTVAVVSSDEAIDQSGIETLMEIPASVPAPHHDPESGKLTTEPRRRDHLNR